MENQNGKPVFFDQNGNRFDCVPASAAAVQASSVQQVEIKPRTYRKYEISPESFFYIKFGVRYAVDEFDSSCVRPIVRKFDKTNADIENYWLKFRMWNYLESESWRRASTERNQYGEYIVVRAKFNEMKVRNLLLEWSFDEPKLMHCGGVLSDESYKSFTELHPNIVRYILSSLESILEGAE